MKMLTVRLPEKLIAEIEHESKLCKISVSDVVRERLQRASELNHEQKTGTLELLGDLIGSVEGLPADLSANKKSYLRSLGYGENSSGGRRISRRAAKSQ
jgi:hypothetical protein